MATGHWDPGYGDVISRSRRAQSAVPPGCLAGTGTLQKRFTTSVDPDTLDSIRQRASDLWLHPNSSQTSYQDHYKARMLDISERTSPRPTSAQRRNKPHPPEVFLTTRLHSVPGYGRLHDIPGYHNPDTTLGKDTYKVDRSLPAFQQEQRATLRSKYVGRANSPAVNQYKTAEGLDTITDPIQRQGTEAWLKLAVKPDQEHVLASLKEIKNQDRQNHRGLQATERSYRQEIVPSLHRYLKEAGAREMAQLHNIDVVTLRHRDIERTRNCRSSHYSSRRGDFLIHPEWTPKFQHHRLNGLSSVDLPYFPA